MDLGTDAGNPKGYDALSYYWGDSKETLGDGEPIMDPGPSRNETPKIQQNLHLLLRRLRHNRYNRFLWIDTICIDRNNPLGKGNQIPLMRDIYQYAADKVLHLDDIVELYLISS